MKKLLYLLLFIPYLLSAQTEVINVGTLPNDGTGDKLRNAMIKINTNFSAVRDSFGNIFIESQTKEVINDSLLQLRADATPLTDVGWLQTDTLTYLATKHDLTNYSGGSSTAGKFYYIKGRVGVTEGLPSDGDSVLVHSNFIGKHLSVFREGSLQQQNADNTDTDGYWVNNTTGAVTFRPVLSDLEQLEVWSTNTIQWESLIPETQPDNPPPTPSSLLTDLIASWKLDETSGSVFADSYGDNDGTTTAATGSTGRIGLGQRFDANTDYSNVSYDASIALAGDELSISLWVRFDNILANYSWLFAMETTTYTNPLRIYVGDDGALHFRVRNSGGTEYHAETNSGAFAADTWYNIIAVVNGAGNPLAIYINNVSSATTTENFTGTFQLWDRTITIGNASESSSLAPDGWMDDVHVWLKILSAGERTTLNSPATYPWN